MTKKHSNSICSRDGIPWGQHESGFNLAGMKDHCAFNVSPDCSWKLPMNEDRYRKYGNCCRVCDALIQRIINKKS